MIFKLGFGNIKLWFLIIKLIYESLIYILVSILKEIIKIGCHFIQYYSNNSYFFYLIIIFYY